MGWWEDKLQDIFEALGRGVAGVKLGPGVLRTIVPIIAVGLVALAGVVYALASNVWAGLIAFIIGIIFLGYAVERAFRYAEKNPIPALWTRGAATPREFAATGSPSIGRRHSSGG